jgi:hypothetical protein
MASDPRQEARRVIGDVVRTLDRRLSAEVRDVPGEERLQLALSHGSRHGQVEVKVADVLAAADDTIARNALRLRIKRAADTMLFRPMPDHRLTVKSIAPPGGQTAPRGGRGRR